jgi:hypothetical protein
MVVLTLLLAKAAYDRYSSQDSRDDDNGGGDTNGNSGAAAATSTSQFCNYQHVRVRPQQVGLLHDHRPNGSPVFTVK